MIPAQRRQSPIEPATEPFPLKPRQLLIPQQRQGPPRIERPNPELVRQMAPRRRLGSLGARLVAVVTGVGFVAGALVMLAFVGQPAAPTVEDAFMADVLAGPGIGAPPSRADAVALGRAVCARIDDQGVTREALVEQAGGGALGSVVVDAARAHLCP